MQCIGCRQCASCNQVCIYSSVRNTRWGYEVRGRIAVNGSGNGDNRYGNDWRNGDNRYGNGWGNDDNRYGNGWGNEYRGWNDDQRGYDSGSFKCRFERGRVVDIDINGIRR